jgi:hypothetical protein
MLSNRRLRKLHLSERRFEQSAKKALKRVEDCVVSNSESVDMICDTQVFLYCSLNNQCSSCMFLGFLDLVPDPLARGTNPDPSIIKQKYNSKKTLDSYCFVTFYDFFIFEK